MWIDALCMNGCVARRQVGMWMCEWVGEWVSGWMAGWMNEWMGGLNGE